MKLGREVPGILTAGVLFVEDDVTGIAKRVKEYDRNAALVHRVEDRQLGIAVHVTDAEWAPGGAWVIAFWANDPLTGDPLTGEPDARVLRLQQEFDMRARGNHERHATKLRMALKMRRLRELHEIKERTGPLAERSVHQWKRKRGIKDKASFVRSRSGLFVPGA